MIRVSGSSVNGLSELHYNVVLHYNNSRHNIEYMKLNIFICLLLDKSPG